jgi:hypothetical protein
VVRVPEAGRRSRKKLLQDLGKHFAIDSKAINSYAAGKRNRKIAVIKR